MKKIIPLLLVFIILLLVYISKDTAGETVTNDKDTYEAPWRSPRGDEFGRIGRILVANNVRNCGEYYLKNTHNDWEFVLACSDDGENWTYYVVYTGTEDIYLASEEMERKLTPPR